MTRKKPPTLLPNASCLQLVRLEADDLIRSALSTLPMLFPEHPLALHPRGGGFTLGRLGGATRTAGATLFLHEPSISSPDLHRTPAWRGGSLCSTHDAPERSLDADRLCSGRGSGKLLGGTDGVRGHS